MHMNLKLITIAGLALALSGCPDLKAVKQYSTTAHKTLETSNPLAQDFLDSCIRSNQYGSSAHIKSCEDHEKSAKALKNIFSVLTAYVDTLGLLAGDNLSKYDDHIEGFASAIKGLNVKGIKEEHVSALSKVSEVIAKALTQSYQQKQLETFLTQADPSFTTVTTGLAEMIAMEYVEQLKAERTAWEKRYKEIESSESTNHPIAWQTYSRTEWGARSEIEKKMAAATALSKSLLNLGTAHATLTKESKDLTKQEVYLSVASFVNEAAPVSRNLKDAFSK